MGVHTKKEVEKLLRDSLRTFCDKNFDFERELKISAQITFLADDAAAIKCSFHETFLAQAVKTQGPLPRKRGRPRKTDLRTKCETLAKNINDPTPTFPCRPVRRSRSKVSIESLSDVATKELDHSDCPNANKKTEVTVADNVESPKTCVNASGNIKTEPTESDSDGDLGLNDDISPDQDNIRTDLTKDTEYIKTDGLERNQVNLKHVCSICGKAYAKPNRLKVHERSHTGDRPYACPRCGKNYRSTASLKMHKKNGCVDRRKKGAHEQLAKQELSMSNEEEEEEEKRAQAFKRRKCKFCEREFSKPSRLLSHERTHTGERPFPCANCNKSYVSRQGLRTHMIRGCLDRRKKEAREVRQSRKPPTVHQCRYCGKNYTKRSRMLVHERTQHTGDRPFLCATCGKSYASKMTLNQHNLVHTKSKSFVCSVCNASFLLPYTLKVHMRVHTGERPHVCWHCGRAFRQHGSFQVHLRTHTNEKPLKCSCCDQRFAHRSLLLKHEMMHKGDRQFSCEQCEKRFWTQHELKTHERTHLGIRRYVCFTCNMRFTQISSLKRHQEGHMGSKKAHNCPVCGKTFTRAHQVSIHMKIHLPNSPYRCTICGTNFKSMVSQRLHMEMHHSSQAAGSSSQSEVSIGLNLGNPPQVLAEQQQQVQQPEDPNPYRALMLDQNCTNHPVHTPQPHPAQAPSPLTQFTNHIAGIPQNISQNVPIQNVALVIDHSIYPHGM